MSLDDILLHFCSTQMHLLKVPGSMALNLALRSPGSADIPLHKSITWMGQKSMGKLYF